MIETFYGSDQLVVSPGAKTFFVALVIGLAFGFALERAGFGSSRKLAGIFYFRDMTVLKVMFTAMISAMLGLSLVVAMGWLDLAGQVNLLPTVYGAQAIGGLIFGVGFVMSGWCPGTAAVGVASGKLDALVFLGGVVIGSVAYNETFGLLGGLRSWGAFEEPLAAFGMARTVFGLLLTLAAVAAFYFAEWVEKRTVGGGKYLNSPFLKAFSLALVVFAAAMLIFPSQAGTIPFTPGAARQPVGPSQGMASAQALLEAIEAAEDHFEPEELADRLVQGDPNLVVVDVRTPAEYESFHIRGAFNVPLPGLLDYLAPYKDQGAIVLYSNGMTHPAQARDVLAQAGYANVYMLTGGLDGFVEWCLKPVSLRREPLRPQDAERVRAWRAFFLGGESAPAQPAAEALVAPATLPGLVETDWLAENLGKTGLRIIDCRSQPEYNTGHVPGAFCLSTESFRGVVGGVPSMLLPGDVLASQLSLMGIEPTDLVVLIPGESVRDATLIGLGLERVGHANWGILNGAFAKWTAEKRPVDTLLPQTAPTSYPAPEEPDGFTVDSQAVSARIHDGQTVILDVRPADYFAGRKSDEARAGHVPGAINRPYTEDLDENGRLKPVADLSAAYEKLIPSKETPVVVHCRTGHQASQTFFVLKHLLGYGNVTWYDAGWTEWAARPELPVEK